MQINKLISAIQNQASPINDWSAPTGTGNTDLNEEDVYDIVSFLKPYYRNRNRNDFTMYLSGWMRKEGIPFESAFKVIECIAADDEEKSARIRTCKKHIKNKNWAKYAGIQDYYLYL